MPAQLRQNLGQSLIASVVALLCIVAIGGLQIPQLNALKNRSQTTSPETFRQQAELEQFRLNLLKQLPAFGFDNLLAGWVLLNFLQYFGDQPARDVTGYQLSPDYFEIIVNHDPRFLEMYNFLSTSVSLYAAMPERSVALLEKGLQSLSPTVPPQSYYVWRQKGIDELIFLGNAQAAQQSFEKAAEWASIYPDPESQRVAALSKSTAEFLARNPDSKLAQVSAWAMVLSSVNDERTRKFAISRIESLGGNVVITPEGEAKIQFPPVD